MENDIKMIMERGIENQYLLRDVELKVEIENEVDSRIIFSFHSYEIFIGNLFIISIRSCMKAKKVTVTQSQNNISIHFTTIFIHFPASHNLQIIHLGKSTSPD